MLNEKNTSPAPDEYVSSEDPYFQPVDNDNSGAIPDSMTGDASAYIKLAQQGGAFSQPLMKRLKYPLSGVAGLLALILIWQLSGFYCYLSSIHWLLAAGLLFAVVVIAGFFCKAIIGYLQNIKALDVLHELRSTSQHMRGTNSVIEKKHFIGDLEKLYQFKYHQQSLNKALESLPDYCDDSETINHLDHHFLSGLDQQAQKVVAKCCRDTAVMVALSPFAVADIGLSLWRTLKMIDDISRIYGISPSLPGRIKLANQLLRQIALTAGADLITDQIIEFTSNQLVGTLSKQAGTALGVSLYTMRIGFHAMSLCRPVGFQQDNRPNFKGTFIDIIGSLKGK